MFTPIQSKLVVEKLLTDVEIHTDNGACLLGILFPNNLDTLRNLIGKDLSSLSYASKCINGLSLAINGICPLASGLLTLTSHLFLPKHLIKVQDQIAAILNIVNGLSSAILPLISVSRFATPLNIISYGLFLADSIYRTFLAYRMRDPLYWLGCKIDELDAIYYRLDKLPLQADTDQQFRLIQATQARRRRRLQEIFSRLSEQYATYAGLRYSYLFGEWLISKIQQLQTGLAMQKLSYRDELAEQATEIKQQIAIRDRGEVDHHEAMSQLLQSNSRSPVRHAELRNFCAAPLREALTCDITAANQAIRYENEKAFKEYARYSVFLAIGLTGSLIFCVNPIVGVALMSLSAALCYEPIRCRIENPKILKDDYQLIKQSAQNFYNTACRFLKSPIKANNNTAFPVPS